MKARAALTSALTGLLFLVVYHACAWITMHRAEVPTCAFAWERLLPVVPWLIVPYWSVDAFFVAAPFLCKDEAELRVLRRRLVTATLAAGVCFLIIPLRLAWERPQVTGMFAPWFNAIQTLDAPVNLFPSMHIVYRTILAAHYARHARGRWRVASHVWFSLIGISTLLTWQHHLVDVLGGFLLAGAVFLAVPDAARKSGRNVFVGCLYLTGCVIFLVLANLSPPWTLLFTWPAAALGVATAASLGVGAAVLGKAGGRLPVASKLVMAPWLLGQWLSLLHYRRCSPAWSEITPQVWIGALPDAATSLRLIESGVTRVLDLTAEFDAPEALRSLPGYKNIATQDLTAPTAVQLRDAASFINDAQRSGIIFIHCKAGYSRTAAAVGAWLLATKQCGSADDVARLLKEKRPGMVVRPEVMTALREFVAEQPKAGCLVSDSHSSSS